MSMNADTLYARYEEYVAHLHRALRNPSCVLVADAYHVKRLSRSEFETMWRRWGRTPGLQERWAARFSAGYEVDAESIRRKFDLALAEENGTAREAA